MIHTLISQAAFSALECTSELKLDGQCSYKRYQGELLRGLRDGCHRGEDVQCCDERPAEELLAELYRGGNLQCNAVSPQMVYLH